MSGPEKKVHDLRSIFGLEATVTTPAVATDGAYVEMDVVLEPGGHTNDHYHRAQEEASRFSTARWRSSAMVTVTRCQPKSR